MGKSSNCLGVRMELGVQRSVSHHSTTEASCIVWGRKPSIIYMLGSPKIYFALTHDMLLNKSAFKKHILGEHMFILHPYR